MRCLSAIFVGGESLTIQCAGAWIARGHTITALVTRAPEVRAWGEAQGLTVEVLEAGVSARIGVSDWLFSVANLVILPPDLLALGREGAVNFHDGPLPRHAGVNAPVWAILAGEATHGIAWHLIEGGVDEGDIVAARSFDIAPTDTALTLNTRCFEAAMESFADVMAGAEAGAFHRTVQDAAQHSYHARDDRPYAAARIDLAATVAEVSRLVRALDHGDYANPLACPKLVTNTAVVLVRGVEGDVGDGVPGMVLAVTDTYLTVAVADGAVRFGRLADLDGRPVDPRQVARVGDVLPLLTPDTAARLTEAIAALAPGEAYWRVALRSLTPAEVPLAQSGGAPGWRTCALSGVAEPDLIEALTPWAMTISGGPVDLALCLGEAPVVPGVVAGWVPLRVDGGNVSARIARARRHPGFARDLVARDPGIDRLVTPQIGLVLGDRGPVEDTVLSIHVSAGGATLAYDAARLSPEAAQILAARLVHLAKTGSEPPQTAMPVEERAVVVDTWNQTEAAVTDTTIHAAFEAQVARTPESVALVFEDVALTYRDLNAAANRAAHVLRDLGVGPGDHVALCVRRSPHLLIGALAILKAGGAYVPLDPAYPADRLALYLVDSGARVVVSETALSDTVPAHSGQTLVLDGDPRLDVASVANPEGAAASGDLAYLIYTSGSTGRPKGVMVEHRNVANFFAGMDARIPHDPPGTWLAVTSLSFDISVLELFWTLARGFKVVISGDSDRALVSGGVAHAARKMDFSLYYWGNDDGAGPQKYQLLLEGAKFADTHGFTAVWTPERHFHAFGGPYPNPSVTGAAVAAVTRNIGVRAGSCVAPLHHPARIAEEWAVIDNLTNGRAGLAFASGWQPDDFVLRPENTPPANRQAMFDAVDQVRRLWRGEAVTFPTATGSFDVVTQPRPVSRDLAVWVTTAGNPATWREAGAAGANVLTHLLGQTIAEVGEKIAIYHAALRAAGHDPAARTVTLMLHTYVARDRDTARRVARGPMKEYLRSAAALIKQYAWAFPAFKRPQGVSDPAQIDLQSLSGEEMEEILDFAFQRYFDDSGLFGTVEDCLARVETLKAIGVDEVACLIDYGIATQTVLEGLFPLAEVLRRANLGAGGADYSIAAQLTRHGVTHLQCTPSMARMIAGNAEARAAMAGLTQLMIGGEALPGTLAADLAQATGARILNMYGPTETTIWSTTGPADPSAAVSPIGRPIANTQVYVLDDAMRPQPVGVAGELWIGGAGVARGYWGRDDLTADRFRENPFAPGRIYGTGDLARWRADGTLDFLGRADTQVKLRGYRIELGEIEAVAEAFAGVRQAVVVAREVAAGDQRLVAYVTLSAVTDPEMLRAHLAAQLPAHMVPAQIVTLDAFPLTPNRKVDRKALPAPGVVAPATGTVYVAPVAGAEETIAAIWARILGVPQVGARDNFFALGGHSLLAVQAHREIRAALGSTKLSITDIFRFPTLDALARYLDDRPAETAKPAPLGAQGVARTDAMAQRRALRAARGGA